MKDHDLALKHFEQTDLLLYQTAQKYDQQTMFSLTPSINYFDRLSRAIVGQQLSTKAAATIWGRFVNLMPNQELNPQAILQLEHQTLREAGLSNAKANYVRGLAEAVLNQTIDLTTLDQLNDSEIISQLTQIKGIGVWTAEMFLMFTLGRPDVFSLGDLGLKRAIEKLYQLDNPSSEQLTEISLPWSPYRTYACRILWQSLDNNPA